MRVKSHTFSPRAAQASDGTLSQDTAAPDAFAPPPVSQEEAERLRIEDERTAASAKVECGICLEIVHEKPRIGERRFGLPFRLRPPFLPRVHTRLARRGRREGRRRANLRGAGTGEEVSAVPNAVAFHHPIHALAKKRGRKGRNYRRISSENGSDSVQKL